MRGVGLAQTAVEQPVYLALHLISGKSCELFFAGIGDFKDRSLQVICHV